MRDQQDGGELERVYCSRQMATLDDTAARFNTAMPGLSLIILFIYSFIYVTYSGRYNQKQEAQLPLRVQGVIFVHSSYRNATLGHSVFLSFVIC